MIEIGHLLISAGIVKGLLLLMGANQIPNEDFEDWLKEDELTYKPADHGEKKFLFTELEKLKSEFREILKNENEITDKKGNKFSLLSIYNIIEALKNRIKKVRLMIDHEVSIGTNLHKPSGVNYVIARAYWIEKDGKKKRTFAKNLGAEGKVYVNGKIPDYKLVEVKKEIDKMMWDRYKEDYKI